MYKLATLNKVEISPVSVQVELHYGRDQYAPIQEEPGPFSLQTLDVAMEPDHEVEMTVPLQRDDCAVTKR